MTKPAVPPPARHDVVEIEAMDVTEWESGQRTPQAPDANLAELVRKSATRLEPPTRVQTVARERAGTQISAPVISRPPSRARTEPPGPPPKPARLRTSGGGAPPPPAQATRVPDIPPGPAVEPRRSPAPMTSSGVDFSLPITATSPGMPAAPASTAQSSTPASGGIDFSLPVTATGETTGPVAAARSGMPAETAATRSPQSPPASGTGSSLPASEASPRPPSEPKPRVAAGSASDLTRTAIATSESGVQLPEPEPLPPTPVTSLLAGPPRVGPAHNGSPFAEPSRVGPGHNASPPGGMEPNTAWPPRPIPVDASSQPARLAAPDASIRRSQLPARRDAGGADPLKRALTRRRLWWFGGGMAAGSLMAIVAAVVLPDPEALPPEANGEGGTQAVQGPGPRRHPRPEQPADRAAADLRDRVRIARNAAAAAAAMPAPAAVDRQPTWSDEPAAAVLRPTGKKLPHKLVVDYTVRPNEPAPPSLIAQSEEDPAIGQARSAYTTGNQRLFVGDLDGAVRAYREALELYPGYVGGYRGLGLAYEQIGDTANALAALREYVAAVPNARDIALIKKRIAHLQRR